MTDSRTPQEIEIDTLRSHNAELLAELKAAKRQAGELTEQVATLTGERDTAHADLQAATVGQPVNAMLERIATVPKLLKGLLDEHGYTFANEDGRIVMRDRDGKVPQILSIAGGKTTSRDMAFTEDDMTRLLCEDWATVDKRSAAANDFAHVIKAPHVSGCGTKESVRTNGIATSSAASTATPGPSPYGIR